MLASVRGGGTAVLSREMSGSPHNYLFFPDMEECCEERREERRLARAVLVAQLHGDEERHGVRHSH